jgi:capsular polysaccharide transport system permease protein
MQATRKGFRIARTIGHATHLLWRRTNQTGIGRAMNQIRKILEMARRNPWFLLGVALPVLLSAIYYFGIASGQYVSESRFVVKSPNQRSAQVTSIASLIQTTGLSGGQEQSNQVIDYVRSRSALEVLVKKLSVRDLYGQKDIDFLSRFPRPWESNSFEDLFDFYQGKVEIGRDTDTGMVVLRTIAFDPKEAAEINETLLRKSEDLVNELNKNARTNAIEEATRRVAEAEKRVAAARQAIAAYRNRASVVDPLREAAGVSEIANRLISERAALEAQLSTLRSVTPDHPTIPALREQIAALTREISRQNERVVGQGNTISGKLPPYDALAFEQELASQLLVVAQSTLEGARTDALKQQFYLERVVNPNVADEPEYPKALRTVLTILGFTLCLYFIIWMFVVGVLEHAPED